MSFVKFIRNALSLSEDAKEYSRRIKSVSGIEFFEHEKQRIEEISSMDTTLALRELIRDTHDENALGYYNKIRSEVLKEEQERDPHTETDQASFTCRWTGSSKSLAELKCSNLSVVHPWKQNEDVCGYKTAMQTFYCFYHQKYCLDPQHTHHNENVRILIQNELGLCNKCYVFKTGSTPTRLQRLPGLYHITEFKSEFKQSKLNYFKDNTNMKEDDALSAVIDNRSIPEKRKITVFNALSALKTTWRQRKTNLSHELLDYFRHKRQDTAAVKIQIIWKYYRLKNAIRIQKIRESECIESSGSLSAARPMNFKSIKQVKRDFSPVLCVSCAPATNRTHTQRIGTDKGEFKPIIKPKRSKCISSACVVCFKDRRQEIDGRTSRTLLQYDQSACFSEEDWTKLEDKLKHYDKVLQIGSIPCDVFFEALDPLWKDITGQQILKEERKSIINHFSLSNGKEEIAYNRFLCFARKQRAICVIHSRLVCMDEKCITLDKHPCNNRCNGFCSDPKTPQFCICGSHRYNHPAIPLDPLYVTQKRGISLISETDLMRVLKRNIVCDISTNQIEPVTFKDATHSLDVRWKTKRGRILTNRVVVDKDTTQVESVPFQNCVALDSSDASDIVLGPELNAQVNSTDFESLFSVQRLENMLGRCVEKTRKQSVIPRFKTSCPLCKMSFFDVNVLEKHLVRRHGADEIKYALAQFSKSKDDEQIYPVVKVHWVGSFRCVPPFEAPIPLQICQNHVPLHPMCIKCQRFKEQTPLYSPLRFYESAYVEISDKDKESRSYHLDVQINTCKVKFLDEQMVHVGKLVAICEDGRGKPFIGVCADGYISSSGDLGSKLATESQFVKSEIKVHWISMSSVLGICYE